MTFATDWYKVWTIAGSMSVMIPATLVVAGILLWRGRWKAAVVFAVAMGTGSLFVQVLKNLIGKPRPPAATALIPLPSDPSFPSGHAFSAVAFYGMLGWLAWQAWGMRRPSRALQTIAACTLAAFFVGYSRLYLGVHQPIDVLAGWAIGVMWAIGAMAIIVCWERKGPPPDVPTPDRPG